MLSIDFIIIHNIDLETRLKNSIVSLKIALQNIFLKMHKLGI